MSRWGIVLATTAFGAGLLLQGCSGGESKAETQKPGQGAKKSLQYPVEVEPIQARAVEYSLSAVGSVEAFERVLVTARVAGVVEKILFTEGDAVREGQVLVEIEPERYRLLVEQDKANLQKSEVERSEAEQALKRRQVLDKQNPGVLRAEEMETWRTKLAVATADTAQQRATLQLSELNLRYALVQAPYTGMIQTRTVQTGQFVQAGATLATLIRREPMLLRFQVPEQEAVGLKSGMRVTFTVLDEPHPYTAKLTHVAEFASEASRMVPITAEIDDKTRDRLRPGSFARVTVPVGGSAAAPVIPQTAVRPSERGFLAFVVEDGVAKQRVLTLGMRTVDGRVEVREGVKPGDLLVIRGAEALREGSPVKVVDVPAAIEAEKTDKVVAQP